MSHEVWEEYFDRLAELVGEHRTTLVFVNTRRMAERVARCLSDRLGEDAVTAHHGSLSKEKRLDAESRLKTGQLKALVATASLELGIDIGAVDLVCQIGSPHRIATLLQRVGRSGHTIAGTPKGRLFPTSRDDLVECAALLRSVRRGELDSIVSHDAPLDVLAQQIVAETACADYAEDDLFELMTRAWPYRASEPRQLRRRAGDDGGGVCDPARPARRARPPRRGESARARAARCAAARDCLRRRDSRGRRLPRRARSGRHVHRHAERGLRHRKQRRRRLSARQRVVAGAAGAERCRPRQPTRRARRRRSRSGSARRRRGATSCRARSATCGRMSNGYWSSRGAENLSRAIGVAVGGRAACLPPPPNRRSPISPRAGAALGALPTQDTIVLERFFDESGGMQLVLHAPFGSRVNKAWSLALRKRFCRQFNFELQAAATEDGLLLSLGPQHSFPLADVFRYLHPATAKDILGAGVSRRAGVSRPAGGGTRRFRSPCRATAAARRFRRSCSACWPTT